MDNIWLKNTRPWKWARLKRKRYQAWRISRHVASCLEKGSFQVLVLFGNKRSGNHLFLNWYMSQATGTRILFNNIRPLLLPWSATHEMRQDVRPNPTTLIFSYEDRDPEQVMAGPLGEILTKHASQITQCTLAIMARDPRNLVASRLKKWPDELHDPEARQRLLNNLIRNTRLALQPPGRFLGYTLVPVIYDSFIVNAAERSALARSLGIPEGDAGLDEVPHYGHGSSFDGKDLHGSARQMDVLNRWKSFSDHPDFRDFMADPRISALTADFEAEMARRVEPVQLPYRTARHSEMAMTA